MPFEYTYLDFKNSIDCVFQAFVEFVEPFPKHENWIENMKDLLLVNTWGNKQIIVQVM
jgi:hypothetical protein